MSRGKFKRKTKDDPEIKANLSGDNRKQMIRDAAYSFEKLEQQRQELGQQQKEIVGKLKTETGLGKGAFKAMYKLWKMEPDTRALYLDEVQEMSRIVFGEQLSLFAGDKGEEASNEEAA